MEMQESEIDDVVREFITASPEERRAIIWKAYTRAQDENDNLYPIQIGIGLREAEHLELSRSALTIALSIPDQRRAALYEISVALSRQERAWEALGCLEDLQREFGLYSYQVPVLALQYIRIGKFGLAEDLLHQSLIIDPLFQKEFSITYDFIRYHQQFPRERAESLFSFVQDNYAPLEIKQIEAQISGALSEGRPYLLLRIGDGEGAHTRICPEDERAYADLYRSNRDEFHQVWYEHAEHLGSADWAEAMNGYDDAVANADCLGGYDIGLLRHEYRIGSRRGIPAVVNLLRRAQQLHRQNPQKAANTAVAHTVVHYDLLLSGALERLLTGRDWIGLLSCHPELPEALARRFGIGHVEFHKVPGERGRRSILGDAALDGEHFPTRYQQLCSELSLGSPGKLYLVAAGLLGKTYCRILQQAGCIVIDIGTVADLWMGKKTRSFPKQAEEHVLTQYLGGRVDV